MGFCRVRGSSREVEAKGVIEMHKAESIAKAVKLGEKLQHVFVATADKRGMPHVAAAGQIGVLPEGRVTVAAWFCPGTVTNLTQNKNVAIVIWDESADTGYQLLGEVADIEERAFMDGYAPELEGQPPSPQVERRLLIQVDKVLSFTHAPHSDAEDGA